MCGTLPSAMPDSVCQDINQERLQQERVWQYSSRQVLKCKIMKILAVIEKSKDGLYSSYSDYSFGNSYFGGFGESVSEVKEDFVLSVKEALEEQRKEGKAVPSFEDIEIEYRYDIPSFFNFFDYINVSRFAEFAGINESKMRAYKSGSAYPGEKTTGKIMRAIKAIGTELMMASL